VSASRDPDWRDAARCQYVDPGLWFPEENQQAPQATALCRTCPSRLPCLEWALDHFEQGVWGGFSENSRIRYVRPARNRGVPLADIIAADDAEAYGRAEESAELAAVYAVRERARQRVLSASRRAALKNREAALWPSSRARSRAGPPAVRV